MALKCHFKLPACFFYRNGQLVATLSHVTFQTEKSWWRHRWENATLELSWNESCNKSRAPYRVTYCLPSLLKMNNHVTIFRHVVVTASLQSTYPTLPTTPLLSPNTITKRCCCTWGGGGGKEAELSCFQEIGHRGAPNWINLSMLRFSLYFFRPFWLCCELYGIFQHFVRLTWQFKTALCRLYRCRKTNRKIWGWWVDFRPNYRSFCTFLASLHDPIESNKWFAVWNRCEHKGGQDEILSEKSFENTTICVNYGRSRDYFTICPYNAGSPLCWRYSWCHPQNLELQEGNSEGGFFWARWD